MELDGHSLGARGRREIAKDNSGGHLCPIKGYNRLIKYIVPEINFNFYKFL